MASWTDRLPFTVLTRALVLNGRRHHPLLFRFLGSQSFALLARKNRFFPFMHVVDRSTALVSEAPFRAGEACMD